MIPVEVVPGGLADMGQLPQMVQHVSGRCGQSPKQWLVSGGYPAHEQLQAGGERIEVYAPVPKPKQPAADPRALKPSDSDAVAAWWRRMGAEGRVEWGFAKWR